MPTILVTGSSRGIGRAIAEALRARGARVIGHSSLVEDADTIAADLSHPPAPQALWELALERAGGCVRSAAIVSASSTRLECPTTRAPRARSASAMARPIPRLDPVTRMVVMARV